MIGFDGKAIEELKDGEPCGHPGCLRHVTHPCEGCGRIAGRAAKAIVFGSPEASAVLKADVALREQIAKAHNELATIDGEIKRCEDVVNDCVATLTDLRSLLGAIKDELADAKKDEDDETANALQEEIDSTEEKIAAAHLAHTFAKRNLTDIRSRKIYLKGLTQ